MSVTPQSISAILQLRCAKLVETGNLSKAFQLATSASVQITLSAQQRIALLQQKHPTRHTASFTARIGYYSMTNAIFQTAILHRLYISQPLIPVGMICTCAGRPTIDTVGRHLFTGYPKHGTRQASTVP